MELITFTDAGQTQSQEFTSLDEALKTFDPNLGKIQILKVETEEQVSEIVGKLVYEDTTNWRKRDRLMELPVDLPPLDMDEYYEGRSRSFGTTSFIIQGEFAWSVEVFERAYLPGEVPHEWAPEYSLGLASATALRTYGVEIFFGDVLGLHSWEDLRPMLNSSFEKALIKQSEGKLISVLLELGNIKEVELFEYETSEEEERFIALWHKNLPTGDEDEDDSETEEERAARKAEKRALKEARAEEARLKEENSPENLDRIAIEALNVPGANLPDAIRALSANLEQRHFLASDRVYSAQRILRNSVHAGNPAVVELVNANPAALFRTLEEALEKLAQDLTGQ